MRVLVAALAALLLVAICSQAEADLRVSRNAALSEKAEGVEVPFSCCFRYVSRPIPRRTILSAYRTSNSCSMQAVVFVTRKGSGVCADPNAPWVQKILEHSELLKQ